MSSLSFMLLMLFSQQVFTVVVDQQGTETTCVLSAIEREAETTMYDSAPTKQYGVTASTITGCLALEKEVRPLYNSTIFERMRQVYREVRKSHPNEMGPIAGADAAYVSAGTVVPFVVQMVPGTPYRGLFVTEDIPQGAVVWRPGYFGTFLTEAAWVDFLDAVLQLDVYGKDLACDCLQWSYVLDTNRWNEKTGVWDYYEDEFMVALDLDESSFTNHGGEEANVADDEVMEELGITPLVPDYKGLCMSCMYNTYAVRDLKAGEEMKSDYEYFYEFGKLEWFEAGVAKAWDVDRSLHDEDQWHYR